MGLFNKILNKLGIKKDEEKVDPSSAGAAVAKPAPGKPAPARPAAAKPTSGVQPEAKARLAEKRAMMDGKHAAEDAIPMVDVMSKLETMAEGTGLDWKVSIVDLLKVLNIDNSLEARKELAQELGCPAELMGGDSAKMNVWLHKTVLKKIAENGGNIPQELLS